MNEFNPATIAAELRALRIAARMSQQDAADIVGCTQRAVGYWENEERALGWEATCNLLEAYGYRVAITKENDR
jgi:transcriptional regulator with XRE-family HTH domain